MMEWLFVMDPIEEADPFKDTTLVLMIAAGQRGHGVSYCRIEDLWLDGATARAQTHSAEVRRVPGDHFSLGAPVDRPLSDFAVIFMRKDPPVDMAYIHATYILERAPATTIVVNAPAALRGNNEKLATLRYPALIPPSMVSADIARILDFCRCQSGKIVVKPVDGRGGEGIFVVAESDPNHRTILETLTSFGRRRVLAQRYLPEIMETGDKRLLVVNGEPLGAVLRRPGTGDFRSNVHSGGRAAPGRVDDRDREICAAIRDDLCRDGIVFAGLDVIGGYLTEINITSPTLVQELTEFSGNHLEEDILDAVETWANESAAR